jgi:lipoic acid synthetase
MVHLRMADVDFLTVGQYLRPSLRHLSVVEYVRPEQFRRYQAMGESLGFKYVASGPLVRSSYRAGEFYIRSVLGAERGESSPNSYIRNNQ